MRKNNVLLLIIQIMSLLIYFLVFWIISFMSSYNFSCNYDFCSHYELEYYQNRDSWWISFTTIPLFIVFLIVSIKMKNKINSVMSITFILVIIASGFATLGIISRYSLDDEKLSIIEEKIDCTFADGTSILFYEDVNSIKQNYKILGEGSIRISNLDEGDDLSNLPWDTKFDTTISKYLPERFLLYNQFADKYLVFIEETTNSITVLSYYSEYNLICFIIVEIK